MMVLKTCKWYQIACLVITRWLVPSLFFLGQILKFTYLSSLLCTMLFVMTSGELNIDLTQKKFHTKVVGFPMNYSTPFAVCWYTIRGFRDLTGGEKFPRPIPSLSEPARNRVKRPSKGLKGPQLVSKDSHLTSITALNNDPERPCGPLVI